MSDFGEAYRGAADMPNSDDVPEGGPETLVADTESVNHLLEEMNAASGELNQAHQAMVNMERQRTMLVQRWQVGSARLAQSVGVERVAQATPYYVQLRRCRNRRSAVEAASARFLKAKELSQGTQPSADVGDTSGEQQLARLSAAHAKMLEQYLAAQKELETTYEQSSITSAAFVSVLPYFQAENDHRAGMAKMDAAIKEHERRVEDARTRYQSALRGLEALSERTHQLRSSCAQEAEGTSSSLRAVGEGRQRPCPAAA
jgi:hypothetical protein